MTDIPHPSYPASESVWSFPRPAIAKRTGAHVVIEHSGTLVADTRASVRTLETSHPPSHYIPLADITPGILQRGEGRSNCEWKGDAVYWDIVIGDITLPDVGWSYPRPSPAFETLRDYVAFYAAPFDRCSIDGESVIPQPGAFYGGWITSAITGPFKGGPGTRNW
ncbi:MAG: DUF427 domain-containing protein [Croceibacterium sp.]